MAPDSRDSLFLPDILPCPVPGRCEFHAKIFGSRDQPGNIAEEWYCWRCDKMHPTTLTKAANPGATRPSTIESLPTELLQHIAGYLPVSCRASLAFASRTLCNRLGTEAWSRTAFWGNKSERYNFLSLLSRDLPTYGLCGRCVMLRHYDSECAWPLLRPHREMRGIQPPVYSVSEFLAQRTLAYYRHGRETGTCMSILACSGTYRKPWTADDRIHAEYAGFKDDDLELGIPIKYKADARLAADNLEIISHVQYQIDLPQPWTSLELAECWAIIRGLYVCPHTLSHWLVTTERQKESTWICSTCPTDVRGTINSDANSDENADENGNEKSSIVIDVWQNSVGRCGDRMTDTVLCPVSGQWFRKGKIREMFESARPL
ncbi:hypothetical protein K469DRAFT_702980 [Zopfia rhizophila CBS 207.26]|uniref:F-box domain-containing protein n=1 Tax=Zopfia rhizophila CBS 207.26 TaxID=1314779 RepID=A0A6A6D9D6_9PEZI|nr:hypothetical protein K469DRAFT_702980 [Zopfia rhizophila CBS 207.26]